MLFKSTYEIKERLSSIDLNSDFANKKSDIAFAERKYIKHILGAEYAALLNDYSDNATVSEDEINYSSMSAKYQSLLVLVQEALAHFTYAKWSHGGHVAISDHGINNRASETEKPVFQWQLKDLRDNYYLKHAFEALDHTLDFLETNKATYALWAADTVAYTINKQYFINSIDQFEKFYSLNNSRRAFKSLYSVMYNVEEFTIADNISEDLYNTIKAAIADASLSGDNKTLVEKYIRPAVAYLTIAQAADQHAAQVTEEGIFLFEFASGEGNNKTELYNQEALRKVRVNAENNGNAWIKKMRTYLDNNASESKFSAYYNSDLYNDPTDETDNEVIRNFDTGLENPKKTFRAF